MGFWMFGCWVFGFLDVWILGFWVLDVLDVAVLPGGVLPGGSSREDSPPGGIKLPFFFPPKNDDFLLFSPSKIDILLFSRPKFVFSFPKWTISFFLPQKMTISLLYGSSMDCPTIYRKIIGKGACLSIFGWKKEDVNLGAEKKRISSVLGRKKRILGGKKGEC